MRLAVDQEPLLADAGDAALTVLRATGAAGGAGQALVAAGDLAGGADQGCALARRADLAVRAPRAAGSAVVGIAGQARAREALAAGLRELGAEVDEVPAYHTVLGEAPSALIELLRKDAVDAQTREAKKQAERDAEVEKARLEANRDATKAQLEADKKKAEAQAELEKKKVEETPK